MLKRQEINIQTKYAMSATYSNQQRHSAEIRIKLGEDRSDDPAVRVVGKSIDGKKLSASERKRMNEKRPPNKTIFVCPLCEKRTIVGITANIVRDHDHKTGKGREWICDSCNTGLGRFKDDIVILERVIEYLKRFGELA